eukprot:5900545-Amphidinium_carterae.1
MMRADFRLYDEYDFVHKGLDVYRSCMPRFVRNMLLLFLRALPHKLEVMTFDRFSHQFAPSSELDSPTAKHLDDCLAVCL